MISPKKTLQTNSKERSKERNCFYFKSFWGRHISNHYIRPLEYNIFGLDRKEESEHVDLELDSIYFNMGDSEKEIEEEIEKKKEEMKKKRNNPFFAKRK